MRDQGGSSLSPKIKLTHFGASFNNKLLIFEALQSRLTLGSFLKSIFVKLFSILAIKLVDLPNKVEILLIECPFLLKRT